MRLLSLGDSYTIGEGVAVASRWPVQLAARLQHQGVALTEPQIIARTGWTTDELAAAMREAKPTAHCALVTLSIGVNNQYRGRSVDDYRVEFTALLGQAIALADGHAGRVVVVSIPDWGVTRFAQGRDRGQITAEIDAFNAAARGITEEHGARFVDITPASRRHGADPRYLAADGLHPSALAYANWVESIAPVAQEALRH